MTRTRGVMAEERQNCWEAKGCGREVGGSSVADLGVCPVALEGCLDGVNSGTNAGRACWVVAGTYCDGVVQGDFAQKARSCRECDFYGRVQREEGSGYVFTSSLLMRLRSGSSGEDAG